MKYTKINLVAKGWSSYNWIVEDECKNKFLLKEVREKSPRKDLAEREGKMLLLANSMGVGPKVKEVNFEENFVVREFVKGEIFLDFVMSEEFDKATPLQIYNLIKEIFRQLLLLDKINLSHNQLQIGKNIIVKKEGENFVPVIIDFEKATIKEENHTRNIGQLLAMCFFNPNGAIAKKIREKLNLTL
jgi:putative serine/threonine protein kinase